MRRGVASIALATVVAAGVAGPSRAEPTPPGPLPDPPPAIVAACDGADRRDIAETLGLAIAMGAPTYNAGDHDGCYRIYERTARGLEESLGARCPGIVRALAAGRATALAATSPSDRAWAMRYAFDAILWALDAY